MTPGSTVDWDKVCNEHDDLIKLARSFAPRRWALWRYPVCRRRCARGDAGGLCLGIMFLYRIILNWTC
jgi:hypothetical protein